MKVAFVYDMDACRTPTGVTRHALSQFECLAERSDVDLVAVSGRMTEPDGLAFWEAIPGRVRRRELPIPLRNAIRFWRVFDAPKIDWWTGRCDWIYCPAELYVSAKHGRRAVTSHDVLQDLRYGGPRRLAMLDLLFHRADLILSVSRFNTEKLLEHFPDCQGRIALVPNGAQDLFFEEAAPHERQAVRQEFGFPPGLPYLLSVANFQPRKNLAPMVRALGELPEVRNGDLGLVLVGTGSEYEMRLVREAVAALGRKAQVRMPGYFQGKPLRAAYSEATALVFASSCESFGIPTVEAMAQGLPVALANSSALPEIGGHAGWYFDPDSEASITQTVRTLLDSPAERSQRIALGREIAHNFRWQNANDRLIRAFGGHRDF